MVMKVNMAEAVMALDSFLENLNFKFYPVDTLYSSHK